MQKPKTPSPIQKQKALGRQKVIYKTREGWAAGHLPVYGRGAEREWSMRKMGVGRWGEKKEEKQRRRWWQTNGRGLEVDGGQLAAGRLRELRHHAGQGPVLSLQPLLNLA